MKILVIEDNLTLLSQLVRALREKSYAVDSSNNGEEGLYKVENWPFDLVILDVMLPGVDGFTVLRRLREFSRVPVILLTARDAVEDRVTGLDLGADDYLSKPFEIRELLARVRTILRRSKQQVSPVLTVGPVSINSNTGRVTLMGRDVSLTAMEYAISLYLIMQRGKIVPTVELLDAVLDENDDSLSNSLNVHLFNIRKKLGKEFIRTVRGRGYLVE